MGSGELYPCPVTLLYSKSKETEQLKERLFIIIRSWTIINFCMKKRKVVKNYEKEDINQNIRFL